MHSDVKHSRGTCRQDREGRITTRWSAAARAIVLAALAGSSLRCDGGSQGGGTQDSGDADASSDATPLDAAGDSASEHSPADALGDDGSDQDGASICDSGACGTLLYRQFDIVRMVIVSQTLVTRTGIQGFFPEGPGVHGIYAHAAGQVQPQLLVHPSPGLGFGLAASDSWLYGCSLIASPALWRVALAAGGAANDVATTGCFDVAASATHVFYTVPDLGQIHTLALSGGAPSPIANTSSQPELLALA